MPAIDIERYRFIYLSKGRVTLVDAEDYDRLHECGSWCYNCGYARREYREHPKRIPVKMHRFLTNAPPGLDVDHKNGNKLDNRKENLRVCTRAENNRNSSLDKTNKTGFKGVCFHAKTGKFRAQIAKDGKKIPLGYFVNPIDAHNVYREAAERLHGEFARF